MEERTDRVVGWLGGEGGSVEILHPQNARAQDDRLGSGSSYARAVVGRRGKRKGGLKPPLRESLFRKRIRIAVNAG